MLSDTPPSLKQIAAIYFKIGSTAFGGPAAQLAMMEDELIARRGWVDHQRFLDFIAVSSLIPGPSSTQTGLYVAWSIGGWPALVVAGVSFIGPAALITGILTYIYVSFGTLPQVQAPFVGVKAAILAIILAAVWRLGKVALSKRWTWGLAAVSAAAILAGSPEIPTLLAGGALGSLLAYVKHNGGKGPGLPPAAAFLVGAGGATASSVAPVAAATGPVALFWYFLKVGSFLYGGGYVLIAFLQGGAVAELGWLTDSQLLDAIAIGQVTPGPLFTIATAVGYIAGGGVGALAATVGIFLPGLIMVGLTGRWVHALRQSTIASGFLDGVGATAVGVMAAVLIPLGQGSVTGIATLVIALGSGLLAIGLRVSPALVIMLGAAAGGVCGWMGWL